jgi:hypothetical protein
LLLLWLFLGQLGDRDVRDRFWWVSAAVASGLPLVRNIQGNSTWDKANVPLHRYFPLLWPVYPVPLALLVNTYENSFLGPWLKFPHVLKVNENLRTELVRTR